MLHRTFAFCMNCSEKIIKAYYKMIFIIIKAEKGLKLFLRFLCY